MGLERAGERCSQCSSSRVVPSTPPSVTPLWLCTLKSPNARIAAPKKRMAQWAGPACRAAPGRGVSGPAGPRLCWDEPSGPAGPVAPRAGWPGENGEAAGGCAPPRFGQKRNLKGLLSGCLPRAAPGGQGRVMPAIVPYPKGFVTLIKHPKSRMCQTARGAPHPGGQLFAGAPTQPACRWSPAAGVCALVKGYKDVV